MQIIELKRLDPEGRAVELVPGVRITPTGLVFEKPLSPDQWREVGLMLKSTRRAQAFLDADWLRYGKQNFDPDMVDDAVRQMEFTFTGGQAAAELLGEVPLEKRRPGLTSGHYQEIARLGTAKEQDKWAKIAEAEKLTPNDLKKSIAAGQVVRGAEERSSGMWTAVAWDTELAIQQRRFPEGWQENRKFLEQLGQQIPTAVRLVELIQALPG
jgi:hypothetical protein